MNPHAQNKSLSVTQKIVLGGTQTHGMLRNVCEGDHLNHYTIREIRNNYWVCSNKWT